VTRFFLALSFLVAMVSLSCSGGDSGGDSEDANGEGDVEAAAQRMISAFNSRDFGAVFDSFSSNCRQETTVEELEQGWEAFGERVGDPEYRLEITAFSVESLTDTTATVQAEVVARTATTDVPMGTASDPFFDLLVKEDGSWKIGDPTCGANGSASPRQS